jgi:hypothetical protein
MDMTLFDECKELLKADFKVMEGDDLSMAMDIFHLYPWHGGNLRWSEMDFSDHEITHEMFNGRDLGCETIFVIADDAGVPVFRTNLGLVVNNFYDIIALSPKSFIFNDKLIIEPLFPHDIIRLGLRK